LRNLEDWTNRFHAEFDRSGAGSNSVFIRAGIVRADRNCRFQQQPIEHDCGTKARHDYKSKFESRGSNNCSQQHIAKHAIAGQHCGSDPADCFSHTANGFADAVNCFSDSECNYHARRSARDDREPMRDAGYQRHGFQFDHGHSWISASCKLQYARNYHCAAGEHKSGNYAIGDCEPLSEYAADYESTDSEMNP
jgi:hypothetical protein